MASVKINIPNIGEVEAVNAATEETLQKILAATLKSEKAKQADAAALIKAQKEQQKKIEEFNKSLEGLDDTAKKHKLKEADRVAKRAADVAKYGDMQVKTATAVTSTFASLSKTALSLGTQMATMYDDMAKNPIAAASGQMNTTIDVVATLGKGAVSATTGLLGMVPGLGGVAAGLDKAAQAAIDFAAQMAHVVNDIMSKEFQKSADALKEYTAQGASFAGGMTEMRNVANDAGLGLKTLQEGAKASSESLRNAGLSQGEGAALLAKNFKTLSTKLAGSGASASDSLMALGYGYQEQMEIQASYMAQQKAAGKDIRNIAPEQLQQGMKDYAKNLKVISDITGEDAKKLMEKARQESMKGALMGKLDADQKDAFTKANSTLAKFGPEVQAALTQQLAGGVITDPAILANKELHDLVLKTAQSVKEGDKDVAKITADRMGTARKQMEQNQTVQATSLANIYGAAGDVGSKIASVGDKVLASGVGENVGTASEEAAQKQMDLAAVTGSTEQSFINLNKTMQSIQISMEQEAGKHLDAYADLLVKNSKMMHEAFMKALDFISGKTADGGSKFEPNKATDEAKALREQRGGAGAALITDQGMDFSAGSFAKGGIAEGPETGYLATLHGKEAIIPMEGLGQGKTIGSLADLAGGMGAGANPAALADYTQASASKSMLDSLMNNLIDIQSNQSEDFKAAYEKLAEKVAKLESENPEFKKQNAPIEAKYSDSDLKDFLSGITDKLAEMHSEVMDKHDDMLGVSQKLLNVSM